MRFVFRFEEKCGWLRLLGMFDPEEDLKIDQRENVLRSLDAKMTDALPKDRIDHRREPSFVFSSL